MFSLSRGTLKHYAITVSNQHLLPVTTTKGTDIEQGTVMDLVRLYYHRQSMTAPAFRLEYIYTMTHLPNPMRRFLVQTAAFRALCESPLGKGVYLSESIKGILKKGGDVAIDFAEALVKLSRDEITDPRKGDNCRWHEHSDGKLCPARNPEPFA